MSSKSTRGLPDLLDRHGIAQVELAVGIGLSESQVSRVVRGETGTSQDTINAILAFLSKRLGRKVTYEESFGSPVPAGR